MLVLVGDRGVRLVVGVTNTALIARSLGPADFGYYAAALVFVAVADTLSSLGLPGILAARLAVTPPALRSRSLTSALLLRLSAVSVVVASVAAWAWHERGPDALRDPRLIALAGLLITHWTLGDAFLQGIGLPQRGAVAKSAVAVVFLAARFLAAAVGSATLWTFVLIYGGEQGVLSIASLLVCKASARDGATTLEAKLRSRDLLRYSMPMWLSQAATLVYMRVDQLLLARLAPPEALAGYAVAVQLVEQAYTIPVIINAVTVTRQGAARARSEQDFAVEMTGIYKAALILSLACSAAVMLAAAPLIRVLFGAKYGMAAPLVSILGLTIPFVTLGTVQVAAIFTGGKPSIQLVKTVITAIVAAPLAIAGWYGAGTRGLAVATVILQAFSCLILNYWIDRESFRQQTAAIKWLFSWRPK